ncbi:MAG: DUF2752 domain-containing protein [Muribaculum sp.]|nr:DUF2752 domain-containing protein [Muribaculaceae bacterium]MCM1080293.1 DUF2752 domain-containing protein [Muribaculum sp.]
MAATPSKKIIIACAAIVILAIAAWVYFSLNPADSHLFPRCMFLQLTGLKCPGCGSQRAVHALLHGDIATAWRMNALLILATPVIILLLVAQLFRTANNRFYRRLNSFPVAVGLFIVIIAWWILRNLFNW